MGLIVRSQFQNGMCNSNAHTITNFSKVTFDEYTILCYYLVTNKSVRIVAKVYT